MKFFDCNCMIGHWPEKPLLFSDVAGLAKQMERFHITYALVGHIATFMSSPKEGNQELVEQVKGRENLIPTIALTPLLDEEFGGTDALSKFVLEHRCAAIRLFPKAHSFCLHSFNQVEIFDFAKQMRLPVILDLDQAEKRFDLIYQLLIQNPSVPIILVCPMYTHLRVVHDLFEQCPNLYGDMAFFNGFRGLESFVSKFGSERLLFSTNMPFLDGGANIFSILYSDLNEEDKANIAFKNAAKLFGLKGDGT